MFAHAMNIIKVVNPLRKKRPANECTSPMGEKIRGLTPLSIRRVVITAQEFLETSIPFPNVFSRLIFDT